METWEIIVSGKVQGVFYRQSTVEKAQELGITGTVRNLENGDVKIIASGNTEQLNSLLVWSKHGPEHARVENVEKRVCTQQSFNKFEVVKRGD